METTTTVAITDPSQTDCEADRRGFGRRRSFCNMPERTQVTLRTAALEAKVSKLGVVEDTGCRLQGRFGTART